MIWETAYWRRDLLRRSVSLAGRFSQKRWQSGSFGAVEQDVMMGFYAIRKLIEAHQVSDSLGNQSLGVQIFPAHGRTVHYLNYHRIHELYDLKRARSRETRSLRTLANQVIHSYVFVPVLRKTGGLDGVLFNSDRMRNKELILIPVREIVRAFNAIGSCDPKRSEMRLDDKIGDYHVSVGRTTAPAELRSPNTPLQRTQQPRR